MLTWIMAGTSNSTIFSYNGYQNRSVSGGPVQYPSDGSGFRLQPTNPYSSTHRRNSSTQFAGDTPGDWGSWHTPTKLSGNSVQTRWIRSLTVCVHCRLVVSSP